MVYINIVIEPTVALRASAININIKNSNNINVNPQPDTELFYDIHNQYPNYWCISMKTQTNCLQMINGHVNVQDTFLDSFPMF